MEMTSKKIVLPFRLNCYQNIKKFIDAVWPLFPEKTKDEGWNVKSNYEVKVKDGFCTKQYFGSKNILNVAYKSTRLELSSLTIWNYEKQICVMYFSIEGNEWLTLNGEDIDMMEEYADKILSAIQQPLEKKDIKLSSEKASGLSVSIRTEDLRSLLKEFNSDLVAVILSRFSEIEKAIENNMPLAAIFLIGSTLEGVLSAVAQKYHSIFLMAKVAPKKSDKIIPLTSWTLGSLIDAGCEVGVIDKSAKSFSIAVRDFRNYVHPNEQVKQSFSPTIDAAKMSYGVLGVAIKQIGEFCKSNPIM